MNILTILILSSVVNAGIFDVFKRDTCDLSTCQSAATELSQNCDENDASIFLCVCNNMPDSFFQNLHDCAVGCGENQDEEIPDASSLKSIYCELATETDIVSGFDGFGGFGDLTDEGSDFDIGSETIDIGTESDESIATTEAETTGTESKTTGTTESNTNGSKTTNSGTTSGSKTTNSGTTSTPTSSTKSETSSSKSETSSKATTANSAAIMNSGLFSCIALMIAMLM